MVREMNQSVKIKTVLLSMIVVLTGLLAGCGSTKELKDGFYTAQMSEFSHGWQEYLIIQVKDGEIVSAEYNAKNQSGFIKAWDNTYMKNMISEQGTYPNKYTREYVQQLMNEQTAITVDTVTGASHSGQNFEKLAPAVLEQAAKGDSSTVIVD